MEEKGDLARRGIGGERVLSGPLSERLVDVAFHFSVSSFLPVNAAVVISKHTQGASSVGLVTAVKPFSMCAPR